jgi:acetyltransferase-like isoleucine patch superfamily enzyme
VIIGDYVTIKSGVQLWDGLRVGDHVFIGPNVTFTNDHVPRAGIYPEKFDQTILEKGASIGANATILVGITIGHYALIGAGSVVTRSIPPFTVWYGNPAKQQGYVTKSGIIVSPEFKDKHGNNYQLINGEPERL